MYLDKMTSGITMSKPYYALICTYHFYFIYRVQGKSVQFLSSETRLEGVLQFLVAKSILEIRIWDHTPNQIVKIEKSPRSLHRMDFFRWYWKKRRVVLQQYVFGFTQSLRSTQSILIAGVQENSSINTLNERLKQQGISFALFHYSLNLGEILFRRLQEKQNNLEFPLIVSCNRAMEITLWFYEQGVLSFVRSCQPSSQQSMDQYVKSSILETLRYLEKSISPDKINIIVLSEGELSDMGLREVFPKAQFFCDQELSDFFAPIACESHESLFDFIVLSEKSLKYPLLLRGEKRWMGPHFSFQMMPWIRAGTALILVCILLLAVDNFRVLGKNRALEKRVTGLKLQLEHLQKTMVCPPLNPEQIQTLQTLLHEAHSQQSKLWQYLDMLSHVLGQRYLLRSLSLGTKQSRILVDSLTEDGTFEEFLDRCQQSFPNTQSSAPSSQSSSLAIESLSPFASQGIP